MNFHGKWNQTNQMKSFYERVKATIQTSSPVEDSKVRKIKWSSSNLNLLSNILTIRKLLRKWLWNATDVRVCVVHLVVIENLVKF